jgi:hypothetical protein
MLMLRTLAALATLAAGLVGQHATQTWYFSVTGEC